MPTNTDLVTDLPADFEVFGQAVDTSMADLLGGTTGQILSKASNTNMDFTWITNDVGDITAVNVTSPITGGGSSGAVTVGIQSASTSQSGAVQLSDSTSTTSSVLAATPTAVKAAYDKASTAATTSVAGIVQLSDSTSTTSSVLASTPTATKSAYDLASSAYAPAFTNNFYAGKNKCMNGAMTISQRGTSFTIAASGYCLDRYSYAVATAVPTGTISQQTFTPATAPVAGYEGSNYMRVNVTANNGCTVLQVANLIEDVRTFAGQTATFSLWAKADATSTLSATFTQNFGSGGSGTVNTTITLSASGVLTTGWVRYTGTVSVPSISGKTIGTSNYVSIVLGIPTSAGVVRNGTYEFWGLQLEAGSGATPFQTLTGSIQQELAACQRYYVRLDAGTTNYNPITPIGGAVSTTSIALTLQPPVTMRTAPSSIEYASMSVYGGASGGFGFLSVSSLTLTRATGGMLELNATVSGATAGGFYRLQPNNAAGYVGVIAEL